LYLKQKIFLLKHTIIVDLISKILPNYYRFAKVLSEERKLRESRSPKLKI